MFKFWHHHGILGINARNLLYIKPLNKKAQIKFADDKMRTKQYLSARGVSTARLLGKITNETELLKFNWDSLPNDFVLKPNAGYGGEGILVIRNKENNGWRTIKGDLVTLEDMIEHIEDILDGRYSISGTPDTVFFEQRLVCHPDMEPLGQFGMPDVRVIVYNMVPVMAMVRVPTRESNGKANIHVGGIGLGVDLSKGEITHMMHYNRTIKEHPDFGNLKGTKIPYWEDILLLATQIQNMITLGYLSVDIVIDADLGPTLLEINARAGLAVQVANLAPLRDRLDRVAGVKVITPEKGVRMAQDLFGNKIERSIQALSGKKVIGMEEKVTLNLKHGTTSMVARMNPTMNKNYLEEKLFYKIANKKSVEKQTLNYTLQGERGKTVFYPLEMTDAPYQMLLGRKALSSFFLDVTRSLEDKKIPTIEKATDHKARVIRTGTEIDPWLVVDGKLAEIDLKLGLVSQLRPINLKEEQDRFMASDSYNPVFNYKDVPEDLLNIKSILQNMKIDAAVPVGKLFEGKRQELLNKVDLIAVIGDDAHFPGQSEMLSGLPPEEVLACAEEALKNFKKTRERRLSYSAEKAAKKMQVFLEKRGLFNWEVKLKEGIVSRCVIGKNNKLLIKAGERFSKWDIDKLIAHEIETHIFCTENGKRQPYQIFRRGTGNYLKTQEGLAVYHQSRVVEGGQNDALLAFHAVMWSREMGFRSVYNRLKKYVSKDKAWKTTVKAKRGMTDTSKPGAFMKNALYYWGYLEIVEYLEKGGDFKDLFLGKFELKQIDLIKQVEGIKEATYLP